ncbi:MAG: HAD hydrolase family protein [Capsulimonadaceae bacterium]|nr:HAD hydrolase family protein [Capsulimonadaceae bacterium]
MQGSNIRAIALDVDGTLTDGSFWWSESGEEFKQFHYLDVMGISRAMRLGIVFALISGEDSPLVSRFAAKLKIETVYRGCKDKASALTEFAQASSLDLHEICFMGDDINDLPALRIAGLAAAPPTAHEAVLACAAFVATRPAGKGAVRSLIDHLWGDRINV